MNELATTQLSPARTERVASWNFSALEWKEFLNLAEGHGILPLVARNLIDHARLLPPEIERSLRSAYAANLQRSLRFAAELVRILPHFERAGLRVIPYKGPLLAESVYHDLGLRSYSDLDLLLPACDLTRACEVLATLGYKPATQMAPAVENFWLHKGNERTFDGIAGKNLLELQWALLPYFYSVDLRVGDVIARAGRVAFCGRDVPALSVEDSLLALCLHAAKHLWSRLIWLVDVAETLRDPAIDYTQVFSRARTLGIARILGVNFWLLQNVLRCEIPQFAEEMIALDDCVPMLGRKMANRMARGATYNFESVEYFRLILKLRERRRDCWRYLWRLIWTPSVGDLAAMQLPERLFPLYRIVRIGRLLKKLL